MTIEEKIHSQIVDSIYLMSPYGVNTEEFTFDRFDETVKNIIEHVDEYKESNIAMKCSDLAIGKIIRVERVKNVFAYYTGDSNSYIDLQSTKIDTHKYQFDCDIVIELQGNELYVNIHDDIFDVTENPYFDKMKLIKMFAQSHYMTVLELAEAITYEHSEVYNINNLGFEFEYIESEEEAYATFDAHFTSQELWRLIVEQWDYATYEEAIICLQLQFRLDFTDLFEN